MTGCVISYGPSHKDQDKFKRGGCACWLPGTLLSASGRFNCSSYLNSTPAKTFRVILGTWLSLHEFVVAILQTQGASNAKGCFSLGIRPRSRDCPGFIRVPVVVRNTDIQVCRKQKERWLNVDWFKSWEVRAAPFSSPEPLGPLSRRRLFLSWWEPENEFAMRSAPVFLDNYSQNGGNGRFAFRNAKQDVF